jgi:hypothetical protein
MAHTAHFTVTEHVVPASHIREYAGATSTTQNEVLYLHLKQYTPSDGSGTVDGAVTLIATHGVGFPKVRSLALIGICTTWSAKSVSGTLRASVGRPVCAIKISRVFDPWHLDRRCGKSRPERGP